MGAARYRLWFLAAGGTLVDGFSIFTLGAALPLIAGDLHIGSVTMGLVGAALVLGAAVGALLGGSAADRFGRKAAFLVDMGILAVGAGLSAVARDPTLILLGQFLVGRGNRHRFSQSADRTSRKSHRGRRAAGWSSPPSRCSRSACSSAPSWRSDCSTARAIRRCGGSSSRRPAWSRSLFLVLRLSLPESPRWLIEHGRADEVAAIVDRLVPKSVRRAANARGPAERARRQSCPRRRLQLRATTQTGFAILFSREYRARTVLVSVPWFLMDIATYGVGLFTPVILGAMHFGAGASGSVAADFADTKGSGLIDVFLLVGFLVGLWAVPRFGRIRHAGARLRRA